MNFSQTFVIIVLALLLSPPLLQDILGREETHARYLFGKEIFQSQPKDKNTLILWTLSNIQPKTKFQRWHFEKAIEDINKNVFGITAAIQAIVSTIANRIVWDGLPPKVEDD